VRILFVAMADSIHTARWISQLDGLGWDVHLFPSTASGVEVHPALRGVTLHHGGCLRRGERAGRVRLRPAEPVRRTVDLARRRLLDRPDPGYEADRLARTIDALRPDVVHTLEIQHAGYLALDARRRVRRPFPKWIVTNWGSDIYLFGRLPEHAPRIREVLASCDFYSCECLRDVALAKSFGFAGAVLPVFPNTGGFDLDAISGLRLPGPPSARRAVMVKGYQGWAGRALVALRALERCADALAGYGIVVYSATPEVELAAALLRESAGVPVRILPPNSPHEEVLAGHGRARLSIGLSVSDAISTSLLEALVMGSFPVQSWTACADEWIEDGATGLLVPPDDPEAVEAALRRALADDALVDAAAERNLALAAERLERKMLIGRTLEMYRTVDEGLPKGGKP
jgi:hypothetical protein